MENPASSPLNASQLCNGQRESESLASTQNLHQQNLARLVRVSSVLMSDQTTPDCSRAAIRSAWQENPSRGDPTPGCEQQQVWKLLPLAPFGKLVLPRAWLLVKVQLHVGVTLLQDSSCFYIFTFLRTRCVSRQISHNSVSVLP